MSFLGFEGKTFFLTGVANRKSVAYFTAKLLKEEGAHVILSVQSEAHLGKVEKLFPDEKIYLCDVEKESEIENLGRMISESGVKLDGFLHSIAFANLIEGIKPFHETKRADFMQASQISMFSMIELARVLAPSMNEDASIVTVSISDTKATSYGYMGPIKASLDAAVTFLAKSLSESRIRVNGVCSGPLKTAASAGIPGYLDNYLFAEQLTMRKEALKTSEVADTICFLLSNRSSGINGTGILIDAGMRGNHFDEKVVSTVSKNL